MKCRVSDMDVGRTSCSEGTSERVVALVSNTDVCYLLRRFLRKSSRGLDEQKGR